MALKTFEHVLILADDVDKTKDFYVDILGLEVGYRPDFPFKGYWLYLKDNKAACIHLAMKKQDTGQDYYIGKKDDVKSGSGASKIKKDSARKVSALHDKYEKASSEVKKYNKNLKRKSNFGRGLQRRVMHQTNLLSDSRIK